MGRRRIADPKNIQIRITRSLRRDLALEKTNYHLPARYKEVDTMQALIKIIRSQKLELAHLKQENKLLQK